jgi:hypothetical protein
MRESKLVQQKFSRISMQLGMKNLGFLDYIYDLFSDEKLSLIVGHVLSKFGYFWSKIITRTDSKTEPCVEPQCAENCPGPYRVRMCPENTPRDMFLTRFDLSVKLFDRYN